VQSTAAFGHKIARSLHILTMPAGHILLDTAVVRQMRSLAAMPEGLATFADSMFTQITRFVGIRVRPRCRCHAPDIHHHVQHPHGVPLHPVMWLIAWLLQQ
jgi:hypothetical protein